MPFIYNRRAFLRNSALLAAAPLVNGSGPLRVLCANATQMGGVSGELQRTFMSPPDGAWPWVYWFVSDGNMTREGITADLEAMHRAGIRGLIYMEVDEGVPKGPVRFLGPQWRELIQHALKEATRLGITVDMNNDGGWCGSGGPWITPELSMQVIVWSETHLEGPTPFAGMLPQPKTVRDYYRDIAVLAFPTPPAESVRMADLSPKFTYGAERKRLDGSKLIDGNPGTIGYVPMPEKGQPQYLNLEFAEPFTAQALTVAIDRWECQLPAVLEASDDGQHFRPLRPLTLRWPVSSANFEKVSARYYQIVIKALSDGWYKRFADGIPLGEVELHPTRRIEDISGKAAYMRQEVLSGQPAILPEMVVPRDQVIDITNKMGPDGRLAWEVPAGKWAVLRLGHTTIGKMNHPAPQESLGLECDKLSKKAVEVQFEGLIGKLLKDQAAVGAQALKMTHIDSWEVGSQNWTPGMREEFQRRYGYDLFPHLPILTGRAVESREVSERFLWDVRRLVADLLLENYAEHMREISHRHGLSLSIEAYADGPLDEVAYGGRADVPTSEFWMGELPNYGVWGFPPSAWVKEMASSGHVYGRPVIAAESFTAFTENAKWQNHPFQMKPLGDWAFAHGINRFVFHRYSMQPWLDRKPGMTMGPWGVNYERTNTWWEMSRGWHTYLARCQALLQMGQFVADIACLGTENSPNTFPSRESIVPPLPAGYDYDILPPEVLLKQATVRDGRLLLESGMSYRLLVLPPGRTMRPALLRKIKELVAAGLLVVGPRPAGSPSLADYPRCDGEVRRLADELWGACDGTSILENRLGNGRVIWGRPLVDVLRERTIAPDLTCHEVTVGGDLHYIHRRLGDDDIYFVASAVPETKRFLCEFRVTGKRPELWWPDTGRVEPAAVYDEIESTTVFGEATSGTLVPLTLDPCGSVFVVFRANAAPQPERVISIRRDNVEISGLPATPMRNIQLKQDAIQVGFQSGETGYQIETGQPGDYVLKLASGRTLKVMVPSSPPPMEIKGPWELEFPKGQGAPPRITLDRLISWTEHSEAGVRYFSGTATYRKKFELPVTFKAKDCGLYLDLGCVSVMAEVALNGRGLGVLWKPPFRVEVTEILRAGMNDLVVRVVNLWPNRLIGDEQLPSDREWELPSATDEYGPLKRYPQWLLENKPSPAGRVTFTTWKVWAKDDPLLESGLIGPVRIVACARRRLAG